MHWPDRYVPLFGSTMYDYAKERESVPIEETAAALKEVLGRSQPLIIISLSCALSLSLVPRVSTLSLLSIH